MGIARQVEVKLGLLVKIGVYSEFLKILNCYLEARIFFFKSGLLKCCSQRVSVPENLRCGCEFVKPACAGHRSLAGQVHSQAPGPGGGALAARPPYPGAAAAANPVRVPAPAGPCSQHVFNPHGRGSHPSLRRCRHRS